MLKSNRFIRLVKNRFDYLKFGKKHIHTSLENKNVPNKITNFEKSILAGGIIGSFGSGIYNSYTNRYTPEHKTKEVALSMFVGCNLGLLWPFTICGIGIYYTAFIINSSIKKKQNKEDNL